MTGFAVILTQDRTNKSVQVIAEALQGKIKAANSPIHLLVLEGNQLFIKDDALIIETPQNELFDEAMPTQIALKEIVMVLDRTYTHRRYQTWMICQSLMQHQVPVVDGQLIPWTHSKIAQYQSLAHEHIFPESVCFDEYWMQTFENNPEQLNTIIQCLMVDVDHLGYPCIIKTAHGSQALGVYRALSQSSLYDFLQAYLLDQIKTPEMTKKMGFIIQEYISPIELPSDRSRYLRLNIVNQEIVNVVQFELGWEAFRLNGQPQSYEKITYDVIKPQNKPIELSKQLANWFLLLRKKIPYNLGSVGLDVMVDSAGNYKLLEVNCGPSVFIIEELGALHNDTNAGKKCLNYANDIATLCFEHALQALKNHK